MLDPGDHKDLKYKQLLTEDEWLEIEDEIYAEDSEIENEPVVGIGAEALKQLLEDLTLDEVAEQLREEINGSKGQKRAKLIKRCLLYTSPSPRDRQKTRMPSSA